MHLEILAAIHARENGRTTLTTGSDGKITLQTDPLRSYLIYWPKAGGTAVWMAVYNGLVIFSEANYQKWAEQCKAARSEKIQPQARPRPWKKAGLGGGWQEK